MESKSKTRNTNMLRGTTVLKPVVFLLVVVVCPSFREDDDELLDGFSSILFLCDVDDEDRDEGFLLCIRAPPIVSPIAGATTDTCSLFSNPEVLTSPNMDSSFDGI